MRDLLLLLPLFFSVSSMASAQEEVPAWPQFRGPGGLSVGSEDSIPLDFGPESRVLWQASVPTGHSSPCVHGDRIFITGAEEESLFLVALDRSNGEALWTKVLDPLPEPEYAHVDAASAVATPCTDGERVFVYFAAYGLVAFDLDGEKLWEQRLPLPQTGFGAGSSPVLAAGNVILLRDGARESALLAFDPETGKEVWSTPRLGFGESHSTPFVWHTEQRDELVVAGTKQLRSYDPTNGEPLWTVDDITILTCTSPTANRETLFFAGWSTPNATGLNLLEQTFGHELNITEEEAADIGLLFDRLDVNGDGHIPYDEAPASRAKDAFGFVDRNSNNEWEREELIAAVNADNTPGKNILVAVKAGGQGDVTKSHVRWSWKRGLPYVSSPLLYRDRLWLFKAGGLVSCLDAATGARIIDRERLPFSGEYYMSPVGTAGHVIIGSAEGTLLLLDATADELKVVHSAEFDEGLFASPAVLEGKVYLRTPKTLWAFGSSARN